MKKKYTAIKLGVMLFAGLYATHVDAQALSGVYTIDNSIAASATNYTSFTSFASDLNANGVNGPVTVNVGGANIYTEQITFDQATGISATNSVTINGNGRIITFAGTSANYSTVRLNGADYMFFHDLVIRGTSTSYALVVHLWNSANYNEFHNCRIEVPLSATSSNCIPFSVSNSATTYASSGNSGNGNIVNTCTLSGGYICASFYGNSTTPYTVGNQVLNSQIEDFYYSGIYNAYSRQATYSGNVMERLFRTNSTTTYAVLLTTGSQEILIEGNHARKLFENFKTSTSTCYVFYAGVAASSNNENILRNNLVSDIEFNGTVAGLYISSYGIAEHNTISLDDPGSNASTTYGIYVTGANATIRNNVISITRGGSSSSNRTGIYMSSASYVTNFVSHNNVFNIDGFSQGNDHIGYVGAYQSSMSAWNSATNQDWNSTSADPMFNNPLIYDYSPTNLAINNWAAPVGVVDDITNAARDMSMPDAGAFEFFTLPCNVPQNPGSFAVPTVSICPGNTVALLMSTNQFTNSGYTIQWYASTLTSLGLYAAVPNATLSGIETSPIMTNSWYQAVVTCIYSGQSATSTPGPIMVEAPTSSTVPYYESFETLAFNEMPNCSWSSTIPKLWPSSPTQTTSGTGLRVPRTGNNFAAFSASIAGSNYYYSNPIHLVPGITYSANLWYIIEPGAEEDWSELTISIGPGQVPAGQVTVASLTPVPAGLYKPLGSTFTVSSAGMYHVSVKANAGSSKVAPFLSWDDLSITIPCEVNSPTVSMIASAQTVCAGSNLNLTGVGANTYSWSTGVVAPTIVDAPVTHTSYVMYGTNTLSGCTSTLTQNIYVLDKPLVLASSSSSAICAGESVTLTVLGNAGSYAWAHGPTSAFTVEKPMTTTSYSVTGSNTLGCFGSDVINITVNPVPVIQTHVSNTDACIGDAIILTGMGADTYKWTVNNVTYNGSPVTIFPQNSGVFLVQGTSAAGCTGSTSFVLAVSECVGLAENSAGFCRIYPNPAVDNVTVETGLTSGTIRVQDVSGRILVDQQITGGTTTVELGSFAAGVYYMAVEADGKLQVSKIVKQ